MIDDTLFTYTTADEQRNLFTGEIQDNYEFFSGEVTIPPGTYRIIEGKLCKILVGSSPEETKKHFEQIAAKYGK